MRVGVIRVELHVPEAHSLKEKRRPVKSLIERLRHKFRCSVAEVDHQDLHQRAAIGLAIVARDGATLKSVLQDACMYIRQNPELPVLDLFETTHSGPEEFPVDMFKDLT